jgi:hypothetical protein
MLLLFFSMDVILLRAIQLYFHFPAFLYNGDLFSPVYFASSDLLPSLGDLLINTLMVLQLAYYYFKYTSTKSLHLKNKRYAVGFITFVVNGLVIGLFEIIRKLLNGLVVNSSISLGFNRLLGLSAFSFTGLFVIVSALFAFLLLAETLTRIAKSITYRPMDSALLTGITLLCYAAWTLMEHSFNLNLYILLCALFIFFYLDFPKQGKIALQSGRIFILLLLTALQLRKNTIRGKLWRPTWLIPGTGKLNICSG